MIMKTLLLLLLLIARLKARDITFVWDKPKDPVDGHIIFTQQGDGWWVNVGEVKTGEEFTGGFPEGEFRISVTAYRWVGGSKERLQSPMATPLIIPPDIPVPTGLRVRISIEIQKSPDLLIWKPVGSYVLPEEGAEKGFFRLKE